ncbi:sugar transferase [Sulfurimonas sp. HSL-3221]|uniref:sugar transferase n=1 Tax=Sulfurimonadaceae TaxID=2771471 RepID=UPI001E2D7176|nr:sugar transferase [Sulfurimonas sp. HSL-3221]UFS62398.1 sugar transferase [Sulfurimonas sp. HSL-3221]
MIQGLSRRDAFAKRLFDILLAGTGLLLGWWMILLLIVAAGIDTRRSGLFTQQRIGRHGHPFTVFKIRTMRTVSGVDTTVTTRNDVRITPLGKQLRRFKLDELPQLFNILIGDMSFVGPRPDVAGYADRLEGEDRVILGIRPGITGPATLKYRDEEALLAEQTDPQRYNDMVIWPDKVRINRAYVEQWSLQKDLAYIWMTLKG